MLVAIFAVESKCGARNSRSSPPSAFGGEDARHDLHIRAGDVPAELGRCEAELGLGQVVRLQPGREREAVDAGLALGVDADLVEPARPARGQHQVLAEEDREAEAGIVEAGLVDGDDAGESALVRL